jgi:hypothetical protein
VGVGFNFGEDGIEGVNVDVFISTGVLIVVGIARDAVESLVGYNQVVGEMAFPLQRNAAKAMEVIGSQKTNR